MDIIKTSQQLKLAGLGQVIPQEIGPLIVGSIMYGVGTWDLSIPPTVAGRLGGGHVPLFLNDVNRMALRDILLEYDMLCSTVNVIIAAFTNTETFGAGQNLVSAMAERSSIPFIGLQNEVYAHVSALAHLSLIHERLGSLIGKTITVSWVYGDKFVPPSTVNSILLLGPLLGSNIRVISPVEFQPFKRVVREASSISENPVEVYTPEVITTIDSDAVIALNWRPLQKLEEFRLREMSLSYRDWYISKDTLSETCLFLTEFPIRTELSFAPELFQSTHNLTSVWLAQKITMTISLLSYILGEDSLNSLY